MASLKVQILSKKLIKPSIPTPQSLRHFNLSIFDQLAPASYVKLLLYYPAIDEDAKTQKHQVLSRLEKSLSETLTKFYPLAGRFDEDNLLVDCSDQGVDYLEAMVDGQLSKFLQDGPESELLNEFMPQHGSESDVGISPLVAIKINMFDCGGFVLGVLVSHKIADACTVITFVNGWARTSRGENCTILESSSLCSGNSWISRVCRVSNNVTGNLKPNTNTVPKVPITKPFENEARIVTKRFVFDGKMLTNLRSKFRGNSPSYGNQPSRVTVVSAIIWKALIAISQARHGHLRPSMLLPAMNLRPKVVPALTDNTFGNFWTPFIAHFTPNQSNLELNDLVSTLTNAVRCAEEYAKSSPDEISAAAIDMFAKVNEYLGNTDVDAVICTSWCRFPVYDADFGWGRPVWTSTLGPLFERFVLFDTESRGGVEAWVSMEEKDMAEFQLDPDILSLQLPVVI